MGVAVGQAAGRDVVAHQVLADRERPGEVGGHLGGQRLAVELGRHEVVQHQEADGRLARHLADLGRQGVVGGDSVDAFLGSHPRHRLHQAVDEAFVDQDVGAARRRDQRLAVAGVAAERRHRAVVGPEREAVGLLDRLVLDPDRLDGQAGQLQQRPFLVLHHLGGETGGVRPPLMRHPQRALVLPQFQQAVDEGARALRPVDPLRHLAVLVPARDDQLVQVDQMVGMQVGQQHRVQAAARAAGADQPLGDPRAAVDQHRHRAVPHQAGRTVALGVALRAAGAEQGDFHA